MADLGEGPGGPGPPLFWVKKEMTEGKWPTGQVKQDLSSRSGSATDNSWF